MGLRDGKTLPPQAQGAKRAVIVAQSLTQQFTKISERLDKNLRFASARALTMTAKDASATVTKDLSSIFDRPNQFTKRSVAVLSATTSKLQSTVLVKDQQADYLTYQEEGGDRRPMPGKPVVLPVKQRTNQFGNIPRGAIGRAKDKPTTFVATGKGRTKHLAPGIYERPIKGKRRNGSIGTKGALRQGGTAKPVGGSAGRGASGLNLLVSFKARASYKPKFNFRDRVLKSANDTLEGNLRRSIADAVKTMR